MRATFARDRARARSEGVSARARVLDSRDRGGRPLRRRRTDRAVAPDHHSPLRWRRSDDIPSRRGLARRLARAPRHARRHLDGRAVARARHRREHGPLLDPQQPRPADAAGARARAADAAPRRLVDESDLGTDSRSADRDRRRRVRVVDRAVRSRPARRDGSDRRRVRERRDVRRARPLARARPAVHAGRRRPRRTGRRRRELRLLAGSAGREATTSSGGRSRSTGCRSRSSASCRAGSPARTSGARAT